MIAQRIFSRADISVALLKNPWRASLVRVCERQKIRDGFFEYIGDGDGSNFNISGGNNIIIDKGTNDTVTIKGLSLPTSPDENTPSSNLIIGDGAGVSRACAANDNYRLQRGSVVPLFFSLAA